MPSPDPIATMPHWHPCTVTHIIDGDTVRVQAHLGLGLEAHATPVRLLGIQAPELHGPDRYAAQDARRYLSSLVRSEWAYLHVPHDQRDRYGRWLGWLWHPRRELLLSINTHMVRSGAAREWWPKGWGYRSQLPPEYVPRPDRLRAE